MISRGSTMGFLNVGSSPPRNEEIKNKAMIMNTWQWTFFKLQSGPFDTPLIPIWDVTQACNHVCGNRLLEITIHNPQINIVFNCMTYF